MLGLVIDVAEDLTAIEAERLKSAFALGVQSAVAVAGYLAEAGLPPAIDIASHTDRAALLMVLNGFVPHDRCPAGVADVLPAIRQILMADADTIAEVERLAAVETN